MVQEVLDHKDVTAATIPVDLIASN